MNKYLVLVFLTLGLSACQTRDEQYYRTHPPELQQAMKACPQVTPKGLTCAEIMALGRRMNKLAYELQYNPQGFGHKILFIQETIASQEQSLKSNKTPLDNGPSLEQNKQDLADYLAVVKWLESPES